MHKLVFFVPHTHKEVVKKAIFEAGAGDFGNYDCCSWESEGYGQFRPLAGSQPFLGSQDEIERVAEYRVETICDDKRMKNIVETLIEAHPYETPAYELWPIKTLEDL